MYGKTIIGSDGQPISEQVEQDATRIADEILRGSDESLSWRDAGYVTAEAAAEALVGADITGDVRRAAVSMVADQIRHSA